MAQVKGALPGVVLGVVGLGLGVVGAASGAVFGGGPSLPTPTTSSSTSTSSSTTSTSTPTSTTSTTSTTTPPSGDYNPTLGTIPPEAAAEIAAFHPTPPGSTAGLVAALAPLRDLGLSPVQAAIAGFGRFPVAGPAVWSDDFLDPRFAVDGTFRFHHATDIPAACGTPVRSPDAGVFTEGADPGGGTTAEVTEADGTYLFMAHLSAYADGVVSGQAVEVGDVIGYVGATGVATGCHLHLEVHPRGGDPVDPKPFLDAWYADALANAPLLIDEVRADHGATGFGLLPY